MKYAVHVTVVDKGTRTEKFDSKTQAIKAIALIVAAYDFDDSWGIAEFFLKQFNQRNTSAAEVCDRTHTRTIRMEKSV